MMEDFVSWFQSSPEAAEYRHLSWEEELDQARTAAENSSEVRL